MPNVRKKAKEEEAPQAKQAVAPRFVKHKETGVKVYANPVLLKNPDVIPVNE